VWIRFQLLGLFRAADESELGVGFPEIRFVVSAEQRREEPRVEVLGAASENGYRVADDDYKERSNETTIESRVTLKCLFIS
jgi:hypothetical protein